ncbi:RND efflux transporter (HlyD family secretion protein) [Desulforapulum autotrophicum HRM2]|jgi:membrane fusion protein (multidrug efflux system)|uniref:RND efflux transporter (HlyD family secretion protein) n=1 Tax=Desulforapulum autotrophicum (strain ATCC 43914 / DSM 3382 / VKM B-1955 / HRM2) TaxID=177437 RepID=C0QAA5_DESAH|nr:efflux RND transporter periplasmic adaptor subunit [Desulforapulum autotrophicum]ACN14690.1 RND efflux transporter (HlyD family secretion protein) [Desulforapulum autotrophicum HRM2]
MKLKLFSGVIAAAIVGLGYLWVTDHSSMAQAQIETQKTVTPPPVEVNVYTVKSESVVFTRDLPGRTSAFQVAEIRPQVTGIILKRLFTEGSHVAKGQQLYQIDPATYQVAYDSAAASLAKIEADLKALAPKVERYTRLVKMGGVSQQAYDDAVAELAQARAGVAVATANLAAARINLDYTKVFAPISGRIGRSSVTQGALVTANQTTALATIQNFDQIYVDVNQSSAELMRLRRQMKIRDRNPEALLILDNETQPFAGKGQIMFSDVTVDPGTGMVQLRILFSNPDNQLLPGLFVRARVEKSRQDEAIMIPQQSLVRNADGTTAVWIVDAANTVNILSVTVSEAIGDKWLVTAGLAPGDRIVTEGLQKIRPRATVTPVDDQTTNS